MASTLALYSFPDWTCQWATLEDYDPSDEEDDLPDVEEDDEETIEDNSELRSLLPFAIIGSEVETGGDAPVRARVYPWGTAEVDNPKHSDFSKLRSALLK